MWCTNDVDPNVRAIHHLDAADPESWRQFPAANWVITNPPFNLAHRIVPLAYEHATRGVAMLLRLSWLEPAENRAVWLEQHPLTDYICLPRYSFTGDGKTDSVTCAWMIWGKHKDPRVRIVTKKTVMEIERAAHQREPV